MWVAPCFGETKPVAKIAVENRLQTRIVPNECASGSPMKSPAQRVTGLQRHTTHPTKVVEAHRAYAYAVRRVIR